MVIVFSWGLQNFYGSLHGGSLAAVCEMVSIACARTVVAEDKDIFLGDMSISYLFGAPINVSFFFFGGGGVGWTFGYSLCSSFNSFLMLSTSSN